MTKEYGWTAATLLLGLLLGGMARVESQRSPREEDVNRSSTSTTEDGENGSISQTFRLAGGTVETLLLFVPEDGTEFPNVLITLSSLLPSANLDMYCKVLTQLQRSARYFPSPEDYEWKSDHEHGVDYVFIPKYHKSLNDRQYDSLNRGRGSTIACTVFNSGLDLAIGTLEVQFDYFSRDLVDREQAALQSIFDECCQGKDQCQRWKQHEDENNASPTDFCHFEGNICNSEGNLLRLNLDEMHMSCRFPGADLRKFSFLKKLQMRHNAFEGDTTLVLMALLEMESVEMVTMSNASFTGPLYEDISDEDDTVCELARAGNLQHFECVACNITGSLPPCLFHKDSRISRISLDDNKLSGKLPKISFQKSMFRVISLKGNELTGKVPKQWTNFRFLQALDLSYNAFNGSVPLGFRDSSALEELLLSDNQFTGPLPSDIVSGERMRFLNASDNQFSGELSGTFTIGPQLITLSLRNNSFSGSLPTSFGRARRLSILDFGKNQFSGDIPEEFGLMRNLLFLHLDDNQLTGQLPVNMSTLHQLVLLDLSSNALTGSIPEAWRQMDSLEILRLDNNKLTGDIPGWMHDGTIAGPDFLVVNITNNSITGFEQSWYERKKFPGRLADLEASSNKIEGEFPPVLARLERLIRLDLSGNQMKGELPSAKGSLQNVQILNLSSNSFSGEIPSSWANISMFTSQQFTTLDLSYNKLTGKIPDFFLRPANSDVLRAFFLKGNELECPATRGPSYVVDIPCGRANSNSSRGGRNKANTATVSTLNDRNAEENADEDVQVQSETSSSPSILVPVLACLAALVFAIAVVILAFMVKSHKKRGDEKRVEYSTTEMQARGAENGHGEGSDHARMLHGVESSDQV